MKLQPEIERVKFARLAMLDEAIEALGELGNIFQGLGGANEMMKRCKLGSKRYEALDAYAERMNHDGCNRSSRIRMALEIAKIAINES